MDRLTVVIGENKAEAYQLRVAWIRELCKDHGIDQRDMNTLVALYDDYYWQVQENQQLENTVNELRCTLLRLQIKNIGRWHLERARNSAGRAGLSALIPATYKPFSWPRVGLRHYLNIDSDE